MKVRLAKKILSTVCQKRSVSRKKFDDACRRLRAYVIVCDVRDIRCRFARRRTDNRYVLADRITKLYDL